MLKLHPTSTELKRIYRELAEIGARALTDENATVPCISKKPPEHLLAVAARLSRHDPRLFHILVDYACHHWRHLNPLHLRQLAKTESSQQHLMVIFNFVRSFENDSEYKFFYEYLAQDIQPMPLQLYFMGLHAPASLGTEKATHFPLQEFLDWGFLSREKPVIYLESGERRELGHLSLVGRINLARKLGQNQKTFSVMDYLDAIEHGVSRQQAIIDLKKSGLFQLTGKGRGAVWRIRKSSAVSHQ